MYLFGTHFTLFTDHKALVFLRKQKSSMIAMFISWWGTLGEFDFDLVHPPGGTSLSLLHRLTRYTNCKGLYSAMLILKALFGRLFLKQTDK
jgi:hypothetical protein